MRIRFLMAIFAAFAFCLTAIAADDPSVGTWKLNPSESKFSSGAPPQSIILRIEPSGDNCFAETRRRQYHGDPEQEIGQDHQLFKRIVSRDKKKMTVTKTENNAEGATVVDIEIFDRI